MEQAVCPLVLPHPSRGAQPVLTWLLVISHQPHSCTDPLVGTPWGACGLGAPLSFPGANAEWLLGEYLAGGGKTDSPKRVRAGETDKRDTETEGQGEGEAEIDRQMETEGHRDGGQVGKAGGGGETGTLGRRKSLGEEGGGRREDVLQEKEEQEEGRERGWRGRQGRGERWGGCLGDPLSGDTSSSQVRAGKGEGQGKGPRFPPPRVWLFLLPVKGAVGRAGAGPAGLVLHNRESCTVFT